MGADEADRGSPAGARLSRLEVGGEELWVLSRPIRPAREDLLAALPPAEREVAVLLLEGASQREIAERRGTRPRTVANQVASIYRKLGVHSRGELATVIYDEPPSDGDEG